eukprot:8240899-Pyramimonas_sp.AAC.1
MPTKLNEFVDSYARGGSEDLRLRLPSGDNSSPNPRTPLSFKYRRPPLIVNLRNGTQRSP